MTNQSYAANRQLTGTKAIALAAALLLIATHPTFAGQTTFEYDNLNRLKRVNFADGSYTQYAYDADGNRIANVTVAKPTLLIQRKPDPMVANEPFTVQWFSTGATSITYFCTAPGTGYNGDGALTTQKFLPDGYASAPGAPQAWVGFDSNCLWTASGPGGALPVTEILQTVAAVPGRPVLTVTRVPNPMVSGKPYRVDWVTTGATSLHYICTAAGTGFNGQSPLPIPTGFSQQPAVPGWVGFPSACRWTATAANGAVTIYNERLVTVPDSQSQSPTQLQVPVASR